LNEHLATDARICGSCGSALEPRDAMLQAATAAERKRDEYPIRQSWTFVVPPMAADLTVTYTER
jgi:hypothetical protein